MNFEVVYSFPSIVCGTVVIILFFWFSRISSLGSFSFPSITFIVSFVYFFIMPIVGLAGGQVVFFGMTISSMLWPHVAILLYVLGATGAFFSFANVLAMKVTPSMPLSDTRMRSRTFAALWFVAVAGVVVLFALGRLSFDASSLDHELADRVGLVFVVQSLTMLLPLTMVLLIHYNFRWWTLIVLLIVLAILLQSGGRARLFLTLTSATTAFAILRGVRLRPIYAILGICILTITAIGIGAVRTSGAGLDFSRSGQPNEFFWNPFGGELGPVFVLNDLTTRELPPLVGVDPWIIGFLRFIPAAIWPNKPEPYYFAYWYRGAYTQGAESAGIAAPHVAEILIQFGWGGVLPITFAYFVLILLFMKQAIHWQWAPSVSAITIIPSFFGFYMQTRGYFFQWLSDAVFVFGPLFLLGRRRSNEKRRGWLRSPHTRGHPAP